ncbi:MAG: NADH-ubiquinone oxidoreductase subunit NDUFA12 family protein [Sphingomicrobium sp.]
MGWFANAFTWWNGPGWGTAIVSRRTGSEAGRDDFGNVYFQHKNNPSRRWVLYDGNNDGSRVPPGWQAWLRGTIDDVPSKSLPPARHFEQPATANLTGTLAAFRPDGALGSGKVRPASTGDYEPWIPE